MDVPEEGEEGNVRRMWAGLWSVDMNIVIFWQVGPCGLTWWAGQLGRWHLYTACRVRKGK